MVWLGTLQQQKLMSHSSGGWKSKIKVLAGLASPEAVLSLQMAAFHVSSHSLSLCTRIPGASPSSHEAPRPFDEALAIPPHVTLIHSLKALFSKHSHIGTYSE